MITIKSNKEQKLPFYKNYSLLRKFVVKYIFKFFLYGYLFLGGAVAISLLFLKLFTVTSGYIKYLQFLWFIPIGYCFIRFIIILSTTNYKWRFYRISHYRLKKREYNENYFKYEIYEPCTRLIVKDILYEFNLKNEYKVLKTKYLRVNQRIEDEKVRLLTQFMRRNETNQIQEVVYGENL